jgi:hypothetical protein
MAGRPSETRPVIDLPWEWLERCFHWGKQSVGGYERKEKEGSRQYARPGIAESVDYQSLGKMGEVAFCLWAGIDPERLDWGPKTDNGVDIEHLGHKVDVKASRTMCLIWPVTKMHFLDRSPADRFVAVNGRERPRMVILGWMPRDRFIKHHKVAPPPDHWDAGTPYMDAVDLLPMTQFDGPESKAWAELSIIKGIQWKYIQGLWP